MESIILVVKAKGVWDHHKTVINLLAAATCLANFCEKVYFSVQFHSFAKY